MASSRMLLMAQPSPEVRARLHETLAGLGLEPVLGLAMFAPENWHQTFCRPYASSADVCAALLRAGVAVHDMRLPAFSLVIDRIQSQGRDPIHWSFRTKARPAGFDALLNAVHHALQLEGLSNDPGHSPHLTISYRAPKELPRQEFAPIPWRIDELLLVQGNGSPYRYDVLARWPLPEVPEAQRSLF